MSATDWADAAPVAATVVTAAVAAIFWNFDHVSSSPFLDWLTPPLTSANDRFVTGVPPTGLTFPSDRDALLHAHMLPRLALASPRSPQTPSVRSPPLPASADAGAANGLGFGLEFRRCGPPDVRQRLVRAGGRDCFRPPRTHMSIVSATHARPSVSETNRTALGASQERNVFVALPMMLHPAQRFEPPAKNPRRGSRVL